MKAVNDIRWQAQGRDRQVGDCCFRFTGRYNGDSPVAITCQRVGGTPCISDSGSGRNPGLLQARNHVLQHGGLAPMQVIGTCRIQHDAIWQIGCHDGGDAVLEPQRQPLQSLPVTLRIGVHDDQIGMERLRFRDGRAGAKAQPAGGEINRQHEPSPSFPSGQDQRTIRRGRASPQPLPDPVCRPDRQVE
ncbi:hypothetical protein GLUCOINTEAF2_0204195 [Komagataeibacter intermedius AF2]|uniref:Uncharacterized protein n=1 Tax=Komagataeibacter intermedius AF2 TaxID=1458464 RepID=A0A0N1FLC0_9PROT|nr:hypothetical protein GLUCOINTEAF2_0204195 [Komagataeibacter intermedius AF2]